MAKLKVVLVVVLVAAGIAFAAGASGQSSASCSYALDASSGELGSAHASVSGTTLVIDVSGAAPDSLYTVWVDFRSRATLEVTPDYPDGGVDRGVAPAFATTAGVTEGMGLDPNSIVTDGGGNASFRIQLDYELLGAGTSPVAAEDLTMQGPNRIGGSWLRVHQPPSAGEATLQMTDPATGLPLVERATAQGLTIVRHPDMVSHGHTPGVGGVDHFPGFKGDFPSSCPDEEFVIGWSYHADRSGAQPLDGAVLDEDDDVAVFVQPLYPATSFDRVEFYDDGKLIRTECCAPYDVAGTRGDGTAVLVNAESRFGEGDSTLDIVLYETGGGTSTVTADFHVDD